MGNTFTITSEMIKKLDDSQARELVARLCKAELRMQNLPQSAVTWGGNQRAKDGGVDVRIDCDSSFPKPDFIQYQKTAIQVKAESFPPSKIAEEMAPENIIRPAISEYASNIGGAYIIISTKDDCSDSALTARKDSIFRCLKSHKLDDTIRYDFFDSRRIADWVEQHPAIVTWVRSAINEALVGWRPYGPWAYNEENTQEEYIVDDKVRVFVPGDEEGSSVEYAIKQLRTELLDNTSVRLVGLSGVGKTRLVQALFDSRVVPDSKALNPENVIYTDLADEPSPQPLKMLGELVRIGSNAVIVVDNCGAETHQRLTEIAKRKNSQIKLITVEYDIRDNIPEGTSCYRLEGASDEIVIKLLKKRYPILSGSDADSIAKFSDGNARVAFALASTAENQGQISQLKNTELFKRLFHQKHDTDGELLRAAEVASLLYSFDGEDQSETSELTLLASIAEVSPLMFRRHMAELQRRALVQQRGKWRAILPHAISNGLAKRAIESIPISQLMEYFITNASDRVARSFTRRIGYLHEETEAQKIAENLLSVVGRLGKLDTLNEFERQMFVNIAPVVQEAALAALERATVNQHFVSTENRERWQFARVARQIAYDPQYFNGAVGVLMHFALAEPESHNNNSCRDTLKSLFYCHLSGTHADVGQRVVVAEQLLNSNNVVSQKLGLYLLEAGLEADHFSSFEGFEFGARKRDYGWQPRTAEDLRSWYAPWINLSKNIASSDHPLANETRTLLGEAVRGLWSIAGLLDEVEAVSNMLNQQNGWPEGWLATRRIMQYDMKNMSEAVVARLIKLENTLSPQNLESQIRAKVLAKGSFAFDLDDDEDDEGLSASSRYQRSMDSAKSLGDQVAANSDILLSLLPELLARSGSSNVFSFGVGVGRNFHNPNEIIESAEVYLKTVDQTGISLIFLKGVVSGWGQQDRPALESFFDNAMTNKIWREWFVELQLCVPLDTVGFNRLISISKIESTPTHQFRYLAGGRNTDPLSPDQIFKIIRNVMARPDHGQEAAFDILGMVIHCANEKDDEYKENLLIKTCEFFHSLDWSRINRDHGSNDHDLDVALNFVLKWAKSENEIAGILNNIVAAELSEDRMFRFDRGNILKPFLKYFPRMTLDSIYLPDENGRYSNAYRIVSDSFSERRESAVAQVPADILIEWCKADPEYRFEFAALTGKLFVQTGKDNKELKLSETAIAILENAPDKGVVLACYIGRFHPGSWSGSLADILEQRLPLLDGLNRNQDQVLQVEIEKAKMDLGRNIVNERKHENERERSRNSSFE